MEELYSYPETAPRAEAANRCFYPAKSRSGRQIAISTEISIQPALFFTASLALSVFQKFKINIFIENKVSPCKITPIYSV